MKIHQGMTSSEILKMFGSPKNISQAVCGGASGSSWKCITWEYGEFPYDKASFTFNGDTEPATLNNFDIDREGSGLSSSFSTENIMKTKQGMSSKEILKTFGLPKDVSQSICGAAPNGQWICTTWEYGKFPYDRAQVSSCSCIR